MNKRLLWLKIIIGIVTVVGLIALLVWLFTTRETAAYVEEVTWAHHVRLLEDYDDTECSTSIDSEGNSHTECHEVTHTRELQHEVDQGTNGLDSTTWPSVRIPHGRQYVDREAVYIVKFHREDQRWNYHASSIPDAKRFKPGKLWLIKVNRVRMVWPQRQTGAEG